MAKFVILFMLKIILIQIQYYKQTNYFAKIKVFSNIVRACVGNLLIFNNNYKSRLIFVLIWRPVRKFGTAHWVFVTSVTQ